MTSLRVDQVLGILAVELLAKVWEVSFLSFFWLEDFIEPFFLQFVLDVGRDFYKVNLFDRS